MNCKKMPHQITILGLVLLLLVGCGAPSMPTPTQTPIPPSSTPTASSVPASATPVPASATPVPASATPVPTSTPGFALYCTIVNVGHQEDFNLTNIYALNGPITMTGPTGQVVETSWEGEGLLVHIVGESDPPSTGRTQSTDIDFSGYFVVKIEDQWIYASSQHTYKISGEVAYSVSDMQKIASYEITATGGGFGSLSQTCATLPRNKVKSTTPPSPAAPLIPTEAASTISSTPAVSLDSPFVLDQMGFSINGVAIPLPAKIQDFTAALGEPSRINKKELGTVYVYDELGITYRTDPGSDIITDTSFYCKDMSATWAFSPHKLFNQPLVIEGKALLVCQPIAEILQALPELTTDKIGIVYHAIFGDRKLSIYTDHETDETVTISIIFPSNNPSTPLP